MASTSPIAPPNGESLGEPLQSEQTRMRMLWDEHMNNPNKTVRHDKTKVLLLSWDEKCDALKTREEVGHASNSIEE